MLKRDERIYVDLMRWRYREGSFFWIRLDTHRTVLDLKENGIEMVEGIRLMLWTDDADDEDHFDPLFFEGTVHFDLENGDWVAIVDFDNLLHASDF